LTSLFDPDALLDQSFELVDDGNTRDGDYCYVRVIQPDGGMAWSSLVWIGVAGGRH
jgi:hypothetical protein